MMKNMVLDDDFETGFLRFFVRRNWAGFNWNESSSGEPTSQDVDRVVLRILSESKLGWSLGERRDSVISIVSMIYTAQEYGLDGEQFLKLFAAMGELTTAKIFKLYDANAKAYLSCAQALVAYTDRIKDC